MRLFTGIALILLFSVVVALHISLAFSIPGLATDSSYAHYRQVENIMETGKPLIHDALSYGGRTRFVSPVFYYLVAAFAKISSISLAIKVIPSFLVGSMIFIMYAIAFELTKQESTALLTSLFAGFVPVFFAQTIATLSPMTLFFPLFFLLIYALLRLKNPYWQTAYFILVLLMAFVHPLAFVVVLGFLIYFLLVFIEHLEQDRGELEAGLLTIVILLWAQLILYKNLLLFHGPLVIWQNIPKAMLSESFTNVTMTIAIAQIGVIPFLRGIWVLSFSLFRNKRREVYLLGGMTIGVSILLWLRLIELYVGLIFLGLLLVALFSIGWKMFVSLVSKSKANKAIPWFWVSILLVCILTSIIPSVAFATKHLNNAATSYDLSAFDWIRRSTPAETVIVALPEEGNFIASLAERKNIIDTTFLLIKDSSERFDDVKRIYSTAFEIEAVQLMDEYNAGYIYYSSRAKSKFPSPIFASSKCFNEVYSNGETRIYEKDELCRVTIE